MLRLAVRRNVYQLFELNMPNRVHDREFQRRVDAVPLK